MIGALDPHILTADVVLARGDRARFIAVCTANGCSHLAHTAFARQCTRTDCGLSDRFHDMKDHAA